MIGYQTPVDYVVIANSTVVILTTYSSFEIKKAHKTQTQGCNLLLAPKTNASPAKKEKRYPEKSIATNWYQLDFTSKIIGI